MTRFLQQRRRGQRNSIHSEMRTATKKNRKKLSILRIVRFTGGEGHIFVDDAKREKKRKRWKKPKNISKGRKAQNRPPSATKQMAWRKYETGLYEGMLVLDQNLIKK